MASAITLEPGAGTAIKSFLAAKGVSAPLRVDLNFRGCCDASLYLSAGTPSGDDLAVETEDITFLMNRETYELVGDVSISYVDEMGKKGFILRSSKPVSEWDGFGVCEIKV